MSTPRSVRSGPRAPDPAGFEGDERFELRRLVGEGGMGLVYEAYDRARDLVVALKTVRAMEAEALYRLKTEFRARADLEHRNLVRLGELLCSGGHWFFTMELVDGCGFLEDCTPDNLRDRVLQLALGLDALHRAGKVHRDLKPSNVLVTRKGRVVVLDFGLVRESVSAPISDAAVVGTAAYMAPEQAMTPAVGPAADCYSLGVMLFEALTGKLPFDGRAIEILMRKQREEAPPVSRFARHAPADLAALCGELLALDPARRPSAAAIVARLSARATPARVERPAPFIGRAAELARLDAAFAAVDAGARTVCIEGQSGIGKSALVHAFAERLEARDPSVRIVAGRCYERESVPFKGIDGVVDSLVRDLMRRDPIDVALLLTPEVEALARIFPVLRRVTAIARLSVRKPDSPIELRARAFRGLRQLLGALAARHPLVVVIDDVQWADSDSLALLREILHPPGAPAILVVLTRRTDGPAPALPGPIETIALDRLSAAEGRALIELLAPERAADADALVDDAGGHPLFLQEMVRLAAGAVSRLDDALWGRVTRMERAARRVLELCAVAAAPVPQAVVGAALGLEGRALAKTIDVLRAAWLVRTGGTRGHDPIEPYHDRVREAVLARIPAPRRRRYHGRLAAALLASNAVEQAPLLVVRHLEAAGALDHAAELAELSARRASDALAFELAAELFAAALRMGRHDDEARRALLVARAEALGYAGRGHAAAEVYLAAAAGAEPELGARCRRLAAHELLVSGHVGDGRRLLDEVLATIGERQPRSVGAARRGLAWAWFRTLVRGTRFTPRLTPGAPSIDHLRLDVYRTASLGLGMVDLLTGATFQARGLLIALRLGDRRRVTYALAYHAMYLGSSGVRVPWARRLVARALELAQACASQFLTAWARAAEGIVEFFAGHHAQAIAILTEAEAQLRERSVGGAAEINHVRVFILFALRRNGDYRELGVRQREYLRDAVRRGDRYAAASFQWSSNVVWLAADDVARARAELAPEAWSPPEDGLHLQHWFRVRGLLELALYEDDRAAMRTLTSEIRGFLGPAFAHVEAVRTETTYLLARIAIVAGDAAGARAAIAPLAGVRAPYIRAFVRVVLAAIEVLEGRTAAARTLLHGAIADADATTMVGIGTLARRRLAELDGDADALAEADRALANRGVTAPARFARMFATWPAR